MAKKVCNLDSYWQFLCIVDLVKLDPYFFIKEICSLSTRKINVFAPKILKIVYLSGWKVNPSNRTCLTFV